MSWLRKTKLTVRQTIFSRRQKGTVIISLHRWQVWSRANRMWRIVPVWELMRARWRHGKTERKGEKDAQFLLCVSTPDIETPDMYDTNGKEPDLLLMHTQFPLSNVSYGGLKRCFVIMAAPFSCQLWLLMHIVRQLKRCHGLLKRFHTVLKRSGTKLIAQERALCCWIKAGFNTMRPTRHVWCWQLTLVSVNCEH